MAHSFPETSHFYCSLEWHTARLSPVCTPLYTFAFALSGGTGVEFRKRRFFVSAEKLADYFGYSACQVRRGLKELEELGFLQLIAREKFRPTHYRVLSHSEWAKKHPGNCAVKAELPWSGEGDPLGQSLWKLSGGTVEFAVFQIKNLRKLGFEESEIEEQFSAYWEETGQRMSPKNVPAGFYKAIKSTTHGEQKCAA